MISRRTILVLSLFIRRALAQGVSDHRPLDSNNEQHPVFTNIKIILTMSNEQHLFFASLIKNMTMLNTKINIEPQLRQLLLLLLLLLELLFLVPGARGGCQGASGSGDR